MYVDFYKRCYQNVLVDGFVIKYILRQMVFQLYL